MQKTLTVFDKSNELLCEYDDRFAQIYCDLRGHFIKLFDTIFGKSDLYNNLKKTSETNPVNQSSNRSNNEQSDPVIIENIEQGRLSNQIGPGKTKPPGYGKITRAMDQINQTLKKEPMFLKGFNQNECGISLKDVLYKQISEQNLVDLIRDVLQSKKSHNIKTSETNASPGTMEQFLYSYLKKKYGLETVVVERVLSVSMAIQEFSNINNEIAAFGLVNLIDYAK